MAIGSGIFYLDSDEMLLRAHCKIADHFFKTI